MGFAGPANWSLERNRSNPLDGSVPIGEPEFQDRVN
jgi:hypothetical protein